MPSVRNAQSPPEAACRRARVDDFVGALPDSSASLQPSILDAARFRVGQQAVGVFGVHAVGHLAHHRRAETGAAGCKSSMSVAVPIHFSMSPLASRTGTARQRVPAKLTIGAADPVLHLVRSPGSDRVCPRFHGTTSIIGMYHRRPTPVEQPVGRAPVYSRPRRFTYSARPSGAATHAICGIDVRMPMPRSRAVGLFCHVGAPLHTRVERSTLARRVSYRENSR